MQEATKNESWYRMYSLVRELEARPLTSFPAIFGEALAAGWLSRRRVYHEALRYERERSGGRLSPFGFSALTAEVSTRYTGTRHTRKSSRFLKVLCIVSLYYAGCFLSCRLWFFT